MLRGRPVVVGIGYGLEGFGGDGCAAVKIVLGRIALWVRRRTPKSGGGHGPVGSIIASKLSAEGRAGGGTGTETKAWGGRRANRVVLLLLDDVLHAAGLKPA